MELRAIVVDDEEIVREGLKKHFDWEKHSVRVLGYFEDGEGAWNFLMEHETDLLITDVRMARMDGIALAKKAVERYPDIGILFISGYADVRYLKDALKVDAVDYILKSIDLEELAAAVKRAALRLEKKRERNAELQSMRQELDALRDSAKESTNADNLQRESAKKRLPAHDSAAIGRVTKWVEEHYMEQLSVQSLADMANLTPAYLCVLFKQKTGMTVNEYITKVRMEQAKELLSGTQKHLYEICYSVGYLSPAYFSRLFRKYTGYTPREWRNGRE